MVLNLCVCYWFYSVKGSRILVGQYHRVGVCSHGGQLLIVLGKSGPYLGGAARRCACSHCGFHIRLLGGAARLRVCSHGGFHRRLVASTDVTLFIVDSFDYWHVTFVFMILLSFYYRRWWDCCVCALLILQLQYVTWLSKVTLWHILAG